ncbi:TolC family protein [Flavobacteriaceae bacterium]|nr:TolC family protein [Flavobacteriaceae bacterium]
MKKPIMLLGFMFLSVMAWSQEEPLRFSLQEAITYTFENNYNAQKVSNEIDIAKKRVWEETAAGLPQINGTIDYQNNIEQPVILFPDGDGGFTPITFGTKQNINAGVSLSQLVFDGAYFVGLQYTRTYLKIRENALEKTEFELREGIVSAYTGVLFTQEGIRILEENISVLDKNLTETQAFVEAGFAKCRTTRHLEITLAGLKNELNRSYRLEEIGFKMLKLAMGIDIEKTVILTDNMEQLLIQNIDLEVLNQTFDVTNHIDYEIALNDKVGSELLVKLEKTRFLPSINAFVNYQTMANNDEFKFFQDDQQWFNSSVVGVSLNLPIFSSLQRTSRTAQAKIQLENSEINLIETEQQLELDLREAQSQYQFSLDNFDTAKRSLDLAERIERKENTKYFEGLSTSFNLTDAQNQLYSSQRNYLQAIYEIITAKAKLDNALNIK